MRKLRVLSIMFCLSIVACGVTSVEIPTSVPDSVSMVQILTPTVELHLEMPTFIAMLEPATVTPIMTPPGMIFVDTLEQEVYPSIENGKRSLAEAIFTANSAKPKDTCAAGGEEQTIIVLMQGTYRVTQANHTPQQGEWVYNARTVGNAVPVAKYVICAPLLKEAPSLCNVSLAEN